MLPVPTRRAALVGSVVLAAAAVGAAVLFSVAGIAAAAGSSATGATTAPAPDPVVTPVAAASVPGPLRVIRRGESNVLTARIDFQPGASTGWHYHPGPVFVQVVAGTLTLSHAANGRCVSQVVPAGQGFFEKPGAIHIADNRGKEPAAVFATFVLPPGAPPSVATPTPRPCH
jgi:quercetin dioxygenase-like cupin family protein